MSIIRCLFLLIFSLPLFVSLGFTQERLRETVTPKASSVRPNEVPADITSTIELDVRVTQETALGPKPAAVSFVVERSSDGMMKGVGNVRLHGYTRYVERDGKRTGQVIITDVSREGKKVYLKGGGLTGNFNIPASAHATDATTQGTGVRVTPKTTIIGAGEV